MKQALAYEDAVDLLDADHKAVKQLFIEYDALCEDGADGAAKTPVAVRICQALTVHAQIEEEIFYPAVREAIGDDALMDEALQEHAEAKALVTRIQGMSSDDSDRDASVQELAALIDEHVLEEREQIFLEARRAPLDLRGLVVPLFECKQALKLEAEAAVPGSGKAAAKSSAKPATKSTAKSASKPAAKGTRTSKEQA